jgi:hypothetical protein
MPIRPDRITNLEHWPGRRQAQDREAGDAEGEADWQRRTLAEPPYRSRSDGALHHHRGDTELPPW